MPKVSINILTKNRAELLKKALASVERQSFRDFELVVVDDASTDSTAEALRNRTDLLIRQPVSRGITFNRQAALEKSMGEYIAILDDDDEWTDAEKLKKQVEFLDAHPEVVLVGGGIRIDAGIKSQELRTRPESDEKIKKTMLLRNNFFTSTVMFRRQAAVAAGGFICDGVDVAEDYDLWLRLGRVGQMHNFQEVFARYGKSSYNKRKFKSFLSKQLRLIQRNREFYPYYFLAAFLLKARIIL